MQIKTTMTSLNVMAKIKNCHGTKCWQGGRETGPLTFACGHVKWHSHSGSI
jgi:hypothetical protein